MMMLEVNSRLVATATAVIGETKPIRRTFHFFADGSILFLDEGQIEFAPWTYPLPYILDFLEVRDEDTFEQFFGNWND
jgi:hypothetical protein